MKTKGGARVGAGRKPAPIKKKCVSFKVIPEIEKDFKRISKEIISMLEFLHRTSKL